MKTVAENYAANLFWSKSALDASSHQLLAKIGDDLRGLYHDMTESDQPSDLLDLAGRVDDLLADQRSGAA